MASELSTVPTKRIEFTVVPEAGISVYSTSSLAEAEFPTATPAARGAISLARRLQDPLAELVKVRVGRHFTSFTFI